MSLRNPLSNGKALAITVGAAGLFAVLLLAVPAPKGSSPSQPVSQTPGPVTSEVAQSPESLFRSRCVQCHALPALTHRTPEDWRILVLKMNRYMKQTGRVYLSDNDVQSVTGYIVKNQR